MANAQDNEQKNDPKGQARNLFFQTALTQSQIAELIGVSQKTISLWMNEGKWKMLKDVAEQSPAAFIEQMNNELAEMHSNIASRPAGKRFATVQEAEVRRKIMLSIRYIQQQQTPSAHIEVLMNFVSFVRRRSAADAKTIVKLADEYLMGEKVTAPHDPFVPYPLPGRIETTGPVTPPEENPGSLNQAA